MNPNFTTCSIWACLFHKGSRPSLPQLGCRKIGAGNIVCCFLPSAHPPDLTVLSSHYMVISSLSNCPHLPLGWVTAQPRPLPFLAISGSFLGVPAQRAVNTPGSWCLERKGPRSYGVRGDLRERSGIPQSGDIRPC